MFFIEHITLVSEPSNPWPEIMPETSRSGEMRREMDELREQVREQGARHEDALNRIQQLLSTMAANTPTAAATPPAEATSGVVYHHNNRNSRVEFPNLTAKTLMDGNIGTNSSLITRALHKNRRSKLLQLT